jgi:hypothetical protein
MKSKFKEEKADELRSEYDLAALLGKGDRFIFFNLPPFYVLPSVFFNFPSSGCHTFRSGKRASFPPQIEKLSGSS